MEEEEWEVSRGETMGVEAIEGEAEEALAEAEEGVEADL